MMERLHFKPLLLLVVALPLLVSYMGYLLLSSSQQPADPAAATFEQPAAPGQPVLINKSPDAAPVRDINTILYKELLLYIALLVGLLALLGHYLKSIWVWICVILLPLGYSLLSLNKFSLSLTSFYLANLAFAVILEQLIGRMFYLRAILRWRMIICSLLGAALLTVYLRGLYLLTATPFAGSQWSQIYVPSLIIFIFATFGLSLADMVVLRLEYKKRNAAEPDNGDDEDA